MNNIPGDETLLTDNQLFEALDLNLPGLSEVKYNWARGNTALAKNALVKYFEKARR